MGQKRKTVISQYKGRLTAEQIASGMNLAMENARRLAEDAQILLERGRHASAASLAVLAIEESGKTSVLRALALARDDQELRDTWKDYRTHTAKNSSWILADLVRKGARTLDELAPIVDTSSDHPEVLDTVKQLGFYTDCVGGGRWSSPSEVITAEFATGLVALSKIFLSERPVPTEEVELWIKHLQPVWRGPMDWMKTATLNWQAEMREKGLAKDDGWEAFLRGTQTSTESENGQS